MNKNKGKDKLKVIETGCNETLLEKFKEHMKEAKSISDIIGILSVLNAEYISKCSFYDDIEDMPDDFKNEIIEFASYFHEKFGESTAQARYENWGENDAFLLRTAESIIEYEDEKKAKEFYDNMTEGQKNEVNSFTEEIFSIRKDRILSFMWGDGDDGSCQLRIPRTIPKYDLDNLKADIKKYVTFIIHNRGALVVREFTKGFNVKEYEIYGYRVNPFGVWNAIKAKEMKKAHCTAPSGKKLPPEKGATYTSRPRNKG